MPTVLHPVCIDVFHDEHCSQRYRQSIPNPGPREGGGGGF